MSLEVITIRSAAQNTSVSEANLKNEKGAPTGGTLFLTVPSVVMSEIERGFLRSGSSNAK